LEQALEEIDEGAVKNYLADQGCEWCLNPPHASHFGGVWERQIGTIRQVLDAMLLELGKPQLTHELLVTLLAEVSAIVHARSVHVAYFEVSSASPTAWKFHTSRPLRASSLEKSAVPCRSVLRTLAPGVSPVFTEETKVERTEALLGKVVEAIASDDGEVRKANVLVCKEGVRKTYLRPISELVLMVESQDRADVN